MKLARAYTMRARANSALRRRGVGFWKWLPTCSRRTSARKFGWKTSRPGADVSVQTVLNVYGSRSELLDLALGGLLAE